MSKVHIALTGAAALGAIFALERSRCSGPSLDGRKAGKANAAAAAELRRRMTSSGLSFAPPENDNMSCAWDAMRASIGKRKLTLRELVAVCDLWLNAYDAGFRASKEFGSLYPESGVNYSTVKLPLPAAGRPWNHGDAPCTDDYASARTRLGDTLCALLEWRDGMRHRMAFGVVDPRDQGQTFARTRAVAAAMDAADYVRDGERAYDQLPGIADVAGKVVDGITGVINQLGLTMVAVLVGGVVVWRLAR